MTAKKATAAVLREAFIDELMSDVNSPPNYIAMLDALLAAARAEAVADCMAELREQAVQQVEGDVAKRCAEAVAPVPEVLRQLVAACHKCANCERPAMRKAANEALYCDTHGYYLSGTQMDDHRIAAPLRAALALLDAHDNECKGGA